MTYTADDDNIRVDLSCYYVRKLDNYYRFFFFLNYV